MDRSRTERLLFSFAVALHVLTAWFSSGYYADDEHYQVITFAEVKAGHEPVSELPWEYGARIRSTLLPSLCLAVFATADAAGIHSPFHKTFLLRLLTTVLALCIVRRWTHAAMGLVPTRLQTAFLLLSWTLWFIPYQHVRFTGETWSGLLMLAATTELLAGRSDRTPLLRAGAWAGLAVVLRPPVVLMALGLCAWALRAGRFERRDLFPFLGMAALVLLGGMALDTWWYDEITCSPWNYAVMGVLGRPGVVLETAPWWAYGKLLVKDMLVPIGVLALSAFAVLWWDRPAGPLLWLITPFLLLHLFIPHKETRFLFPLVDLIPLLLVQAFQAATPTAQRLPGGLLRIVLGGLVLVNIVGAAIASFTPAGSGRTKLAQELGPELPSVHYAADPVTVWKIAVPRFYGGPPDPAHRLDDPCGTTSAVIVAQPISCNDRRALIARAEPSWSSAILEAYHWRLQDRGWGAYRTAPIAR